MARREWTEEDQRTTREMAAAGHTDAAIAEALGRKPNSVMLWRQRNGVPGGRLVRDGAVPTLTRVVSETPERVVIAPEESDEEPIEELWSRSVRSTRRAINKARTEGYALIRLMTDRPIAISLSSDWHVTPRGACDLEGLREYAAAIQQEPGAYAVAVGDLMDNPIKWTKQMGDPPSEVRLIDHLFGVFGSKLLATTDGNHDKWSKQFAGIDNIERLANLRRVHYAEDELIYTVELVSPTTGQTTARYCIASRHQYRRNSSINVTHACWRWLEDNLSQWPKAEDGGTVLPDVLAIGHNHVAAVEDRTYEGGKRWAARMGAWKLADGHGRQYGWGRTTPTAPTFIFYPHRARPVEGYADYARALEILRAARAEAAQALDAAA